MDIIQSEIEFSYRKMLRRKVLEGNRLTQDEKLWLETHKKYSAIHGLPYLMKDTIQLEQGKLYRFHITFLNASHKLSIEPCFYAPNQNGKISTNASLYDFNKKKSRATHVAALITHIDSITKDFYFTYYSELGVICVSFYSEQVLYGAHITKGSQDFEGYYMIRKDLANDKIVYHCSANGIESDFDSLVFFVEWEKLDE